MNSSQIYLPGRRKMELNVSIEYLHFKMNLLDKILELDSKVCFMESINLKDSYFAVSLAWGHRKFLGREVISILLRTFWFITETVPRSGFHEMNWGTPMVKEEAIKSISGWKNLFEICLKIAGSDIHSVSCIFHWANIKVFIFPPLSLIAKILIKVEFDVIPFCIITLPLRKTQHWYPKILKLLVAPPLLLPKQKKTCCVYQYQWSFIHCGKTGSWFYVNYPLSKITSFWKTLKHALWIFWSDSKKDKYQSVFNR